MRKKWVMGNWKMNGSRADIDVLLRQILASYPSDEAYHGVIFPPAIYIPLVSELLQGTRLAWGGQNVHAASAGAFTGEVSAEMLLDYGCRYVLVGHSERRHLFQEDEKCVAEKFHRVKDCGMIPVLCLGETLSERQNDQTKHTLLKQLRAIHRHGAGDFQRCIIAYEPVWAIGTGQTANPDDAEEVHGFIRDQISLLDSKETAQNVSIVYGGSVNAANAAALFAMPNIDGGLVGGASLHAQSFLDIMTCIN